MSALIKKAGELKSRVAAQAFLLLCEATFALKE